MSSARFFFFLNRSSAKCSLHHRGCRLCFHSQAVEEDSLPLIFMPMRVFPTLVIYLPRQGIHIHSLHNLNLWPLKNFHFIFGKLEMKENEEKNWQISSESDLLNYEREHDRNSEFHCTYTVLLWTILRFEGSKHNFNEIALWPNATIPNKWGFVRYYFLINFQWHLSNSSLHRKRCKSSLYHLFIFGLFHGLWSFLLSCYTTNMQLFTHLLWYASKSWISK